MSTVVRERGRERERSHVHSSQRERERERERKRERVYIKRTKENFYFQICNLEAEDPASVEESSPVKP